VYHAYGDGLDGMDYQRDEPVAMAAPATNEVTALIALEFHLKLMIPSGGPNLAPHSRWTATGGAVDNDGEIASFFVCLLGTGGRGR
jgi:hypothetical protein